MTIETRLPRSTPEMQGIPSSAIHTFVDAVEQNDLELHSLMVLRHGQVVAEGWWSPYAAEHLHILFSLSKSFASTAVGLAVAEGRLTVDDRVITFFPDETPAEVGEHLASMRVRHLLSMSTGHHADVTAALRQASDGNWVKAFLAQPVEHAPGTHFAYNSAATYMLSAIVQKLTGITLLEYLGPRLLAPLGIEGATWESCPRGISIGGWGMSIKTEDIACFGQLYLQKGMWNGQRLLSEAWVTEATARQVANDSQTNVDWQQGYGYQFWRCRHGAYRGDGAFGQFCVVMPEQDAVLAITSGVGDMQAVLNLVWAHLLPALGTTPLPENTSAQQALQGRLNTLALSPLLGERSSPVAATVSGKQYGFEPNEQKLEAIRFDFTDHGAQLTLRNAWGEHPITPGNGAWQKAIITLEGSVPYKIAASGAWTAVDTYTVKLQYYETPFSRTITSRFVGDQVLVDLKQNVSFGSTESPQLVGKLSMG